MERQNEGVQRGGEGEEKEVEESDEVEEEE